MARSSMDSTVSGAGAIPATEMSVLARFRGRSDESEFDNSDSDESDESDESEAAWSSSDPPPNTATPAPTSPSPASFRSGRTSWPPAAP